MKSSKQTAPFRRLGKAAILALIIASAYPIANSLVPTEPVLSIPEGSLGNLVPTTFSTWKVDPGVIPITPDPTVQASLDRIYNDVLVRTYVNHKGQQVMLSIAYGKRQSDNMRLHDPQGCYSGQGFEVSQPKRSSLTLNAITLPVTRLVATKGVRHEPVTYWMVIGGKHVNNLRDAKLAQLSYGIRGGVPDGLLIRVSSIDPSEQNAFETHRLFIGDMIDSLPPSARTGIVGGKI